MFNSMYISAAGMVNLLLLIQSTTNKYDVWIALFTALFSFLGMLAAAVIPILAARRINTHHDVRAAEVKDELQVAVAKTDKIERIVNGNTSRLMDQNDALRAENERLRNAQA